MPLAQIHVLIATLWHQHAQVNNYGLSFVVFFSARETSD